MSDSEISCWTHKQVQYDWLFALALSDEEDPAARVQVVVAEPAEAASGVGLFKLLSSLFVGAC